MTESQSAQVVGAIGPSREFERAPLSQQEMYQIASALGAQIVWTFEPAVDATEDGPAKRAQVVGEAPYGRFVILRDDLGGLVATFQNKADLETPGENGSFNVGMTMPEAQDVATAKGVVVYRLVESMNQTNRDDPMLVIGQTTTEEDLL